MFAKDQLPALKEFYQVAKFSDHPYTPCNKEGNQTQAYLSISNTRQDFLHLNSGMEGSSVSTTGKGALKKTSPGQGSE